MNTGAPAVDAERAAITGPTPLLEAILQGGGAEVEHEVPLLAAGLEAARRPLARFQVDGLGSRVEAVAGDRAGLVLAELDATTAALRACTPSGLLGLLVTAVRLGPRPRDSERPTARLTPDAMAALLGSRSAVGAGMAGEEAERLQPVLDGLERHWRIEVRATAAAARVSAGWYLEVVDSTRGLWLVEDEGELVTLRPTDATAVLDEVAALPGRVGLGRST